MYLVGNGRRVHFWKDFWLGEEPLSINFPFFVFFGSQYGGIGCRFVGTSWGGGGLVTSIL